MASTLWRDGSQRGKEGEELQEENARLKKMFADLSLVHEALKDAVAKKL
jgi:putative transposase